MPHMYSEIYAQYCQYQYQFVQLRLGQAVVLVAGVRAGLREGGKDGRHHTGSMLGPYKIRGVCTSQYYYWH